MARPSTSCRKKCGAFALIAHGVTALYIPQLGVPRRPRASAFHHPRPAMIYMSTTTTTTTPDDASCFSDAFDSHQIDALIQRGELEASLMKNLQGTLEGPTVKVKKISKKKKDNNNNNKDSNNNTPSSATFARELKRDGVVRVNNALSASTAAMLRAEVLERRSKALEAIDGGDDWRQYFADVLLKSNRCDLLLPLKGSRGVQLALRELLLGSSSSAATTTTTTTLSNVLRSTVGDDAMLYELAALVSEPGSPRQPVHPDNPFQAHAPLFTLFVALQDIHSSMGPTIFLPKTHTAAAHAEYDNITFQDVSQRDNMLEARPNVAALLNAGDVSIFDSRTMHCGGANDSIEGATRALLYVSFRNPSATQAIGNVGSIMSDIPPMTLGELRTKLASLRDDDVSFDPFA